MKHLRLCAPAGLAVAACLLGQVPALAQGSTGGNIGNRDKGVSGAFDTPSAPSRREAPARARKSSGGGGGGNFDGQWKSVAVSNNAGNGMTGTVTGRL